MTYHLLRTRLAMVVDPGTHHWRVHPVFGDRVLKKKITSRFELSILANRLFDGSYKCIVYEVRLDYMFNEPRLILEDAAPERRFNLLLRVAELGRANKIVAGTRRCCTKWSENICVFVWFGRWSMRRIGHDDELEWGHRNMGEHT